MRWHRNSGGIRLQKEGIVEEYLSSVSVLPQERRVATDQNIHVLGDISLRMRLDNLLHGRTRIQFLPGCHCNGNGKCGWTKDLVLFSLKVVCLRVNTREHFHQPRAAGVHRVRLSWRIQKAGQLGSSKKPALAE